jgi:hypothetical protein
MEGSERTDKIDYQIEKRVLKNVKEISWESSSHKGKSASTKT